MELTLDNVLGGDSRMVCSRLPERVEPLHTLPSYQDILETIIEGMTDVKRPGNIGRRDGHGERFTLRVFIRVVESVLTPEPYPFFFHLLRIVCFRQLNHKISRVADRVKGGPFKERPLNKSPQPPLKGGVNFFPF